MATPKLVKMIGVTNIAIIFNIFLHFDLLFLPWLIGASVKKVENFNVEFDVCDNVLQQNFDKVDSGTQRELTLSAWSNYFVLVCCGHHPGKILLICGM